MARDDNDNGPSFPAGWGWFEGNITKDPKELKGGAASFTVAANYRNNRGEEGTHFINVVCFQGYAENVLDNLQKGSRAIVGGRIYGHTWENSDGDEVHDIDLVADWVAPGWRFSEDSGGGSRRSSGRSRRRSSDDDDEDEAPRRSRRRSSDDDDEDDAPRRRSSGTRQRRRRAVEDDGDDID